MDLSKAILSHRVSRYETSTADYRRLYKNIYLSLIISYAKKCNVNFFVTDDVPSPTLSKQELDIWYIYRAWLDRRKKE